MTRTALLTLIAPVVLAACGTPSVASSAPSTSPTATVFATPTVTPTPAPTPTAAATPTPAPATAPPRVAPSVFVASNMALGAILVNPQGRTLYYFVPERGGRIVCTGQCTSVWPTLFATSMAPTAGAALPGQLGIVARASSEQVTYTTQVTYSGHPLYYFVSDSRPGDTNGEGSTAFGAGWDVLSPTGGKIEKSGS